MSTVEHVNGTEVELVTYDKDWEDATEVESLQLDKLQTIITMLDSIREDIADLMTFKANLEAALEQVMSNPMFSMFMPKQ